MIDGTKVSRLRRERKISQAALADEVGCAQSLINKIESGEAVRTKYHLEIAQALGVDPAVLQAGGGHMVMESRGVYDAGAPERVKPRTAEQVLRDLGADVRAGVLGDEHMQLLHEFAMLMKRTSQRSAD